ncbi:hypothetical protein [Immundisolibacter cernigliae]|uniref:Uncharacterized protein n=1 Tax=Immundisolibacter cernigliae TaxID=1810504 RepID=A0A1B1YPW3_9GAMM|nr:hypothetical protein [Immundisolibacter cernigliae]ANX02806.1 hypothetical protein PG2T_00395 [Immundisolibacter cernigliae]
MAIAYDHLKADLALCTGTRKAGQQCNGTVHVCGQCGARGCKQNRPGLCSEQAFDVLDQCLKCGAHAMQPAG